MLTNISTKTTRYPQIHRAINNLSLCMLLKKSVSFIRFETQGIRNRVNVPKLKTNRSTDRKTHIFGRKNLGCYMSSPPPPPGALGSNRPRQGAAEKVLKLELSRLRLSRPKTAGESRPHRPDRQRLLLSLVAGWGEVWVPLSSVMLTLRVGMVFEWEFQKLVKGVKFFFGMKVCLRILWHET